MGVGSTLAGVARVAVEVDTGTSEQNLAAFDRRFTQTTGAMNEGAIRVELASRRLQRTLAQYPADSDKALRATLALKAAQRSAATEAGTLATRTRESGHAFQTFSHDVERAGFGIAVGSRAIHGLRSALFFSASGLAGFGLTSAIRASRDAAIEQQAQLGQLQAALKAAGLEESAYAGRVKEVIDANERLGFSEDSTVKSFTLAVRATKDIEGAHRLQAIAADVARGRNMDLVAATQLLVRVQAGQVGSLRRLGIEVDKGISGAKALDAVQRQYAGAATTYADSAAGAQARLNVAIHSTEETIGTALLPTITSLNTRLANWLDNSQNQKRIQNDVNSAVGTGVKVAHDLEHAWDLVGPPVKLASRLLGGTARSIEVLGGALVALKLRSFASDLGLLSTRTRAAGASAAVAAGEYDTMAAAEGRAAAAGRGVGGGGLGRVGGALAVGVAADLTWQGGQALSKYLGSTGVGKALGIGDTLPKGVSFNDFARAVTRLKNGDVLSDRDVKVLRAAGVSIPVSDLPVNTKLSATSGAGPHGASAIAAAANTPTPKRRTSLAGLFNVAAYHLAQAGLTASTTDDVKYLDEEERILRKEIAAEKNLAKRTDLVNQLGGVLSQLQSIQDAKDHKAADTARTAKEKRAKALEASLKRKRDREKALNAKIKRLYDEDVAGSTSNANQALKDRSEYLNKKYGLGSSTVTKLKSAAAPTIDTAALARELRDAVAGLAQYAPNVAEALGTVVHVHQNFPHPPTQDGHREAIFARHALTAAFDG